MNYEVLKKVSNREKDVIIKKLKKALEKHAEISFAYLHGSFITGEGFKDIDIAIYLKEMPLSQLEYELKIESELMKIIERHPVDVRILNTSPLSFKYNVIKDGIYLIVRNDDERADFQEVTLRNYFDFAPYRNIYLKETLGFGV